MKKIVSLVLALVLVLAIAAPAMAITGSVNPDVTTIASAPFTDIDLVLIESAPLNGLGILSLQAVAANKAYVKDSLVHFALYFKTPVNTTTSMALTDYSTPGALISSDVVSFMADQIKVYKIDSTNGTINTIVATAALGATSKSVTVDLINAVPGPAAASYVLVGSGVVSTAANGTILAELLGAKDSLKFKAITYDPAVFDPIITNLGTNPLKIYAGKTEKYTVSASTLATGTDTIITYDVAIYGSSPATSVQFVASRAQTLAAGSTHNLSGINVKYGGVTYLVVDQGSILAGGGSSSLKFYVGGVEETNATIVAALTSAYTGVMSFFGFNYTAAGVLHPEHFARKASVFYAYDSAAITLYTSAITVPDEDTDVPQTGDAASSIGFVMIALAIVAAAGVAYKKVRA